MPSESKKHYRIESLKNNTLHKLCILQPVTSDSGLYRCILPTSIETNSQCSIESPGVDFLQHLTTPVHVEYMKSVLLECELSKRPQNVIWKDKNGKVIEDSDKYEVMDNGKLQGKKYFCILKSFKSTRCTVLFLKNIFTEISRSAF